MKTLYTLLLGVVAVLTFNTANAFTSLVVAPSTPVVIKEPSPNALSTMNESTIGSAAIAHLLPLIHYADMDGPLLLEEDLATGIDYDFGKVTYSNEPGLGINYTGLFSHTP